MTYASETDLLNVALFGMTTEEWRDANLKCKGNIRGEATINQLLVYADPVRWCRLTSKCCSVTVTPEQGVVRTYQYCM